MVATTTARIVVGIDGSEASRKALRWAFEEAAVHALPLDVVCVWQMVYAVEPMVGMGAMQISPHELANQAELTAKETIEAVRPTDSTVEYRTIVVEGVPGRTLVEQAEGATMLVVGRHGHHPILSKLLGSVAEYAIHHTSCPVVTIPVH